ncbi:MAG TPA: mechanosensitive ion channel family protein [Rhodanobacteraceae bacterium]
MNAMRLTWPGPAWFGSILTLIGAGLLGLLVWALVFSILGRIKRGRLEAIDRALVNNFRMPLAIVLPLCGVLVGLASISIPPGIAAWLSHAIEIILIALAAWLAVRSINAIGDVLAVRHPVDIADNLRARKIQTQFKVLHRVSAIMIGLLAVGVMLITFPRARALGTTMFASAGVAGLVLGLAARPVLTNLFAGIQIALAQPIRLEDSVVVEGEWGWIEEINATYVVVRIWDLRRLVLPISYFIEKPFANWTRTTANLLGTAFIYADYTVPIQAVRDELERILKADELWDGFAWSLDVTNLTEHVVEMRAMVSAANAGNTVNLRRHVREKLVTFLQKNYPECLPRTRVELTSTPRDNESSGTPTTPSMELPR